MRTLLVRTGGLGDCILTLPVVSCLRRISPDSELHILGNGTMLSLARLTGCFDRLHDIDNAGFASLFTARQPSQFLRSFFTQFDDVYFFTAADSAQIAGTVTSAGAHSCHVCNPKQPPSWNRHISGHLLSILEVSDGQYGEPCEPVLEIMDDPASERKGLAIHPGSGGTEKNWPAERFVDVAKSWEDDVTFILGPAEIERGLLSKIPGCFDVVCPESLDELYGVLSASALYLGNDSGVSHLASLAGTRSVVLFGPTDPVVWKPLGDRVVVISSGDGTMEGIECGRVLAALNRQKSYS